MTVMDILTEALMTANIIGAGNPTPDAASADTAFRALLGLIDTSNADPLKQLVEARAQFALSPGKQAYTIGPDSSLDINQPRPQDILRANVIDLTALPGVNHVRVDVLTWSEYEEWGVRNSPTPLPQALWYDRGFQPIPNPVDPPADPAVYPGFATIYIVGTPTAPNLIEFWARTALTPATSYFDTLFFPDGYYEYLLYGLTIRLYPRFGRPVDPTVASLYSEARLALESANATPAPRMQLDGGLPNVGGGYWDGRTNSWIRRP
jgi:hypothetical protein